MLTRPARRPAVVIHRTVLLAVTAFAVALTLGMAGPTPSATPTLTPTVTPTLTRTLGPTSTATLTPTPLGPTSTATITPTLTPTATMTLEPTATATPTRLPTATPTMAPPSNLPTTLPGLSRVEGVFLVTAADNGSRANYFIASNQRHSILSADMQLELARNPLWPVTTATRDDVLAFPEGAPVGAARTGLVTTPVAFDPPAEADVPQPLDVVAAQPAEPVGAGPEPVAATPDAAAAAAEPVASQADAASAFTAPAATLSEAPAAAEPTLYLLKSGDNLTHLSAQYGTTIEAILAANGLTNANRIYVGQSLIIPTDATPAVPVVEQPRQPVAITPPQTTAENTSYTVQAGDSAIIIARQFNVDLDTLLAANNVANRNRVYVGQVLLIP